MASFDWVKSTLCGLAMTATLVVGQAAHSNPGTAAEPKIGTLIGPVLLRALSTRSRHDNVIISPLSLNAALLLAALGAKGSTLSEFENALAMRSSLESYVEVVRNLTADLAKNKGDVNFTMANAAWHDEAITLKPEYVDAIKSALKASTHSVKFGSPPAAQAINAWVAKETAGAIDTLVSDTSSATRLMLTNAISFKAKWQQPFDTQDTRPWPFRTSDGTTTVTQMMFRYGDEVLYAGTGEFEVVRLPYAGGHTSLQVMVPRPGVDLSAWLAKAKLKQVRSLLEPSQLKARKGYFGLPKLALEFDENLVAPLRSLGLTSAFSGSANFGAMADEKLTIDQVIHKVIMTIDEEGTEAAATTGIGMSRTALDGMPLFFSLIVDRPFLLAVRHERTGSILFFGAVGKPM